VSLAMLLNASGAERVRRHTNGVETTVNGWIQPRVSLIVLVVTLAT
jgi:hypothetical protein